MELKATTAKSRLGQISHHFLSDHLSRDLQKSDPFILSILTNRQGHCLLPVDALVHSLLIRGISSITLNTGYGTPTVCRHILVKNKPIIFNRTQHNKSSKGLNIDKLEDQLNTNTHSKTEVCFMPISTPDSQYLGLSDVIVIPVIASTEGIQAAYSLVKNIGAHRRNALIGITIVEAKDHIDAQLCFDKLAMAVKRFLNLDVISYGYLPVYDPSNCSLPHQNEHSLYPLCISGIVDLITLDRKEWLASKDSQQKNFQSPDRIEQRVNS